MRTKLIVAVAAVLLIAAAYLAGYLPQHGARIEAEGKAGDLQTALAAAEARVRTGVLLGRVLTLKEVTMRQNYGQALELSSSFFDAVRAEAATTPESRLREGLNEALARRDPVTAALAKSDPGVIEILHSIELQFRRALEYQMPPEPASTP